MLTIYSKDGSYVPTGKANHGTMFDSLKQAIVFSQAGYEHWDGEKYVIIKPAEINALVLTKDPKNKETVKSITVPFDDESITIEYDNEMSAKSQLEKIADAKEKGYPFVPLEGNNYKIAVRTSCLKG